MLVLKRQNRESIRVGEIIITVVEGGPCKLGIQAPPEVDIVRTELERAGPWASWIDQGGDG